MPGHRSKAMGCQPTKGRCISWLLTLEEVQPFFTWPLTTASTQAGTRERIGFQSRRDCRYAAIPPRCAPSQSRAATGNSTCSLLAVRHGEPGSTELPVGQGGACGTAVLAIAT